MKHDLHDERRDYREELAQVRAEQRLALQESLLAEERTRLAQSKECLLETAPVVESTIALPLKQKFVLGQPELDVEAMKERLKLEETGREERMAEWRQKMAEWRQRKALHEEEDNRRRAAIRENGLPLKSCGCGKALEQGHCCCSAEEKGHCGCEKALAAGHCCCHHHRNNCEEKTCEFAPLREQPFTEKPPEMPREAIMASEIPLKMRMRMVSELGESRVSRVRTGREAIEEIPRQPLKGECNNCTDKGPKCELPGTDAAPAHPPAGAPRVMAPPIPEPDPEARTAVPPVHYQSTGFTTPVFQPLSQTLAPVYPSASQSLPPIYPSEAIRPASGGAPMPAETNYRAAPILPAKNSTVASNLQQSSLEWVPWQGR